MAMNEPDMPHTQTSAPVEPSETTKDVAPIGTPEEQAPRRQVGQAGDEKARGDRMPKGADEPGAGM